MECSICLADFDMESEGGIAGQIGMIPVAFCPTCRTGIHEFMQHEGFIWPDTEDY